MTGQIFLNENDRLQIDNRELCAGDILQVLVVDGRDGKEKWIDTSIEYSESKGGYYLTGILGYSIPGLFGKIS